MGDIEHGKTYSYTVHKCRCEECRVAWNTYCLERKASKAGTLSADDPRHGTENAYGNYGCRCRPCTDVWSAARINQAKRHKANGGDLPQRGNTGKGKLAGSGEIIRERISAGQSCASLAKEYGVSVNAIYLLRDGVIAG